jgi:hypothetical protein
MFILQEVDVKHSEVLMEMGIRKDMEGNCYDQYVGMS